LCFFNCFKYLKIRFYPSQKEYRKKFSFGIVNFVSSRRRKKYEQEIMRNEENPEKTFLGSNKDLATNFINISFP